MKELVAARTFFPAVERYGSKVGFHDGDYHGTFAEYGERVLRFLRDNGLMIVMIVGGLCLLGLTVYLITNRGRAAVKTGREQTKGLD